MIDISPYIDKLEILKEVMAIWIDFYMDAPVIEERNTSWREYYESKSLKQ